MSVTVVIPWAPIGCPHRERAYAWVRARLAVEHPSWEVVEGRGGDPWCKAAAVEDGLSKATGDVLIVHDADVHVPNLAEAVETLKAGAAWVMPHTTVHRFNEPATTRILAGEDPAAVAGERRVWDQDPYHGWPGGGVVVLHREDYWRAPMDLRYAGFGSEDDSFALALRELVGGEVRLSAPLWHLWHPPQRRLNRKVGSAESAALWSRYRRARGRPDVMARLVAEGRPDGPCNRQQGRPDEAPEVP